MMRLALALAMLNAACLRTTSFHCTKDSQCGDSGRCESVGYCSFIDTSCTSGRRFGELGDIYANSCVGDLPGGDAGVDARRTDVTIGGMVTGLTGNGLKLRNNGGNDLGIDQNGGFTFSTKLPSGSTYHVTIANPPSGQDAYVGRGDGTANGNVSSVLISCFPAGSDPGIRCDTGVFCRPSNQVCCFDKTEMQGSCVTQVDQCTKIPMACDSAGDCGGGANACCAHYHNGSGLQDVSCVATAGQCTPSSGGAIEILCDPNASAPCSGGGACTGTSMLGSAYHTCQ